MQASIVQTSENVRAAAEDITLEAYRLGSTDNISAVVVALNFSGPVPVTAQLANAVRNLSNRGVRPPRQPTEGSAGPHALTTTFDTGARGLSASRTPHADVGAGGGAPGVNGARDSGLGFQVPAVRS